MRQPPDVTAAHTQWWLGLLGRLDADLEDDLDGMEPAIRLDVVRRAWREQQWDMPAVPVGADDPAIQADRLRYLRLLALFAGRAGVGDPDQAAAGAGLELVEEMAGGRLRARA
ncbi:MAG: hypothetical protein M3N98_04625 [Actinomycetota bacterium]|nr:hypothetical protein [Actinomycetota bacterium]